MDSSSQTTQALGAFSLDKLIELAKHDVFTRNWLRRVTLTTYDEFLDVLYDDLQLVIERLEENPQDFPDEAEDATTKRMADILWGMQYTASHNLAAGGNVDLTAYSGERDRRFRSIVTGRHESPRLSWRPVGLSHAAVLAD